MEDRRLIEEFFPVREVGEESVREKNIRHGHISALHIWWARRPLAASRATIYAALVPPPKDTAEWRKKREFIARLSKWENQLNQDLIEEARKEILEANGGKPPRVLDPFAGGGSIPLEALRLGCETYAGDYNPVAALILKCALEYPQKYGRSNRQESDLVLIDNASMNRLLEDVKKWGKWVLEEAKKEIARFYPSDEDGSIPIGYIWARTIPCQNPACGAEIPLMRQFWLANKKDKEVSLYPYVLNKRVYFKIVGTGYDKMPESFEPKNGTISKAIAKCFVCGSVNDGKSTARLFREGKAGQMMVAVVLHNPKTSRKSYRIANDEDMKIFYEAEKYLEEKRKKLQGEWGIDPVPDEPLPPIGTLGFRIQRYGMVTWGDLFNSRQKLTLVTFVEKIRLAYDKMREEGYDEEYAKAIVSYLALNFDIFASYMCLLARYRGDTQSIERSFDRQAVQMVWDYGEANPFGGSRGDWRGILSWILEAVKHCGKVNDTPGVVIVGTATKLPYLENYFDAVFTDPPYYDNVPYSYLSDFFYVWLKRILGHIYPELFVTPLTPKSEEIVTYSNIQGGLDRGKKYFEDMLKKSFLEIYRVLRPNGIAIIVYAHKSLAGWETLVNSLLDSGLIVSGAWPIRTEMESRLRASESAALASSIYMVARKMQRIPIGFYREVKQELRKHLNIKLDQIWNEGVSGADFFISAIGSAMEVFGKYERVIDYEDNVVRADRFLEDVRKIVTDYAVRQVLHNGFAAEIKPITRFYVLWRWAYGDKSVEFDEARKLGQSLGIDVSREWNKGFIVKKISKRKVFIEVLGPEERKLEDLENSTELIDVLHRVLLLWKKGKSDEIVSVLREMGYGKSDVFYRVAQAISESLPNGNSEKKLLEGFLAGKERVVKEALREAGQTRLFE